MTSLMLYHHPLSVCSMKVRLALEEKGLAWSGRVIDILRKQEQLEPWYLKLNPKGVIPTLELRNGTTQVLTDSAHIIRLIASLPEGNTLLPESETDKQSMDRLVDLADGLDVHILSYARHPSMEKSEKILDARIEKAFSLSEKYPEFSDGYFTCAARSEKSKKCRIDNDYVKAAEKKVFDAITIIENTLKDKPFLLGSTYTLADVMWTVILSRIDLLGYDTWLDKSNFPQLAHYYLRMQQRQSYTLAQVQNEWWDK